MEELTGIVKYLIHPESNGFLTYVNSDGEEESIYFSCSAQVHKKSHSVWLKGDVVTFVPEQQREDRLFARITGFVKNDLLEELVQRLEKAKTNVLLGRLKVHYDKLYFVERETKISFFVTNLLPEGLKIDASKLYEAYYDQDISTRCVRLTEAEYVVNLLRTRKRTHQPIMAIVSEVSSEYLSINIPNSYVMGRVLKFDKERGYSEGDIIYVYFVAVLDGQLAFVERDCYVDRIKNQFAPGKIYKATVTGIVRKNSYTISILGTAEEGILRYLPQEEADELNIGDEISVIYYQMTRYAEYIFLMPEDYQRRQLVESE